MYKETPGGKFTTNLATETVHMMLLQDATICEQDMKIGVLESSSLAKSKQLVVDEAILNTIQLLYVIYDRPTCFTYEVPNKSISTNRHTDTNETFRAERNEGDIIAKLSQGRAVVDDAVCGIKHSLLCNALGKDGGLGDIKLQTCIFFEYKL
jgi:hypothetical protein